MPYQPELNVTDNAVKCPPMVMGLNGQFRVALEQLSNDELAEFEASLQAMMPKADSASYRNIRRQLGAVYVECVARDIAATLRAGLTVEPGDFEITPQGIVGRQWLKRTLHEYIDRAVDSMS